jgi:hypothetical protein
MSTIEEVPLETILTQMATMLFLAQSESLVYYAANEN